MTTYRVSWFAEIEAKNPQEAASLALLALRAHPPRFLVTAPGEGAVVIKTIGNEKQSNPKTHTP